MHDQMDSRRTLRLLMFPFVVASLFFLIGATQAVYAASYSVGTSGSGSGYLGCDFEPRAGNVFAGDGLILTASDACDWIIDSQSPFYPYTYTGQPSAGTYGSDTSLSNSLIEALGGAMLNRWHMPLPL